MPLDPQALPPALYGHSRLYLQEGWLVTGSWMKPRVQLPRITVTIIKTVPLRECPKQYGHLQNLPMASSLKTQLLLVPSMFRMPAIYCSTGTLSAFQCG